MTEQYKDAYQNKYREEITQVHAPLNLIEKTKAAVREEEKRLTAAQGTMSAAAGTLVMQEKGTANSQPQNRIFSVRKWAYPLTAAAALLILASVSLTMRGLKSKNKSGAVFDGAADSGAVYEAAAEEMSVMESETSTGMAAEAAAADEGYEEMATPTEDKSVEELEDQKLQKKAAGAQKQKAESEQQRGVADIDDFTMEKVAKRPARFSGSDVKIRRYEGKTFRILEKDSAGNNEEKTWETYVELSTGEGYVIYGEAENVDDFLAAAYQKLEE